MGPVSAAPRRWLDLVLLSLPAGYLVLDELLVKRLLGGVEQFPDEPLTAGLHVGALLAFWLLSVPVGFRLPLRGIAAYALALAVLAVALALLAPPTAASPAPGVVEVAAATLAAAVVFALPLLLGHWLRLWWQSPTGDGGVRPRLLAQSLPARASRRHSPARRAER